MANPNYPATDLNTGLKLFIPASNQIHDIVNGTASQEVTTDSGKIPSIRKMLVDNMAFKAEVLPWTNGDNETDFRQLRLFDGVQYFSGTATDTNPIPMGVTPIGDTNWAIAPTNFNQELFRGDIDSIVGGKVYPRDRDLVVGDTIPSEAEPYTHVRVGGNIYAMSPLASGVVADLTATGATIGGVHVLLFPRQKLTEIKLFSSQIGISSASDFAKIRTIVETLGVEYLHVYFDKPLTISDGVGTYCSLINTTLKKLRIENLIVDDTATYNANFDICRLFDLDGIDFVEFESCYAKSFLSDITADNFNVGLTFVRSKNSKSFYYNGQLVGGYRPFEVWNTEMLNGYSYCEGSRYNGTFQLGCGIVDFKLVGRGLRRDFYLYSCSGGKLDVDGTDTYGHTPINLIVQENGQEVSASNLTIKYKQRNTRTYAVSSRLAPIYLGFQTLNGAAGKAYARNIDIIYDVEGDYGTLIDHQKLIDSSGPDTVARGYEMSNISISGTFKTTKSGTTRLFNFKDSPNWFAGDVINNYRMDNLNITSVDGFNFAMNLEMLGAALIGYDALVFNNFIAKNGFLATTLDYGRKVKFTGNCELSQFYTDATLPHLRGAAFRDDFAVIDSGQTGISFMVVDAERANHHIRIECDAFYSPDALNSSVSFSVIGQVSYNASGVASNRTTLVKQNENRAGTIVNPVFTAANNTGVLSLSFPEWLDNDVKLRLKVRLDYEPYINKYNTFMYGLVNKQYQFTY